MRYRHFRNSDPPALAAVWNDALMHRGAVEVQSLTQFDDAVLNKPYFDPNGLIVAEDEETKQIVGFAHGGFSPNAELTAVDRQRGMVCAVLVKREFRRRKIGTQMLQRVEDYLHASGATTIQAGPTRPGKPFYTGMYGGSNAAGFLTSDTDAEPFFLANHYQIEQKIVVLDRRLDTPINIVDPRFTGLKRKYEAKHNPQPKLMSWWRESAIGHMEPSEYRLDDKITGATVAKVLFWEMRHFGWRWGGPSVGIIDMQVKSDFRRQGLAKYLISQLLRHLHDEYYVIAEVQCPERQEDAIKMFKTLGFVHADNGQTYRLQDGHMHG